MPDKKLLENQDYYNGFKNRAGKKKWGTLGIAVGSGVVASIGFWSIVGLLIQEGYL